jgi:hypothetical protein
VRYNIKLGQISEMKITLAQTPRAMMQTPRASTQTAVCGMTKEQQVINQAK